VTTVDYWELAAVLALVLVAALLAAAEVSITRMSRFRAYHLEEEGNRGAKAMVRIAENPARYLNVVLLLTLLTQLGGTTLAGVVAIRHFHHLGEVLATAGMTVILFVFAEVSPKTFAVQHTDRVGLRLAPIVVAVAAGVGPLAAGLIKIANALLPGKGLPQGPFVTEDEIRAMAEVASEDKSIDEEEKDLIHSIFEFGDTLVREVMVPRPDMIAAPIDSGPQNVLDLVLRHGFSRIPVYRNTIDEIEGLIYAKDLLRHLVAGKSDVPLDKIMREAYFVPDSKKVADLLREMQQRRVHIAIVLDEYGSTAGLVTIEDLVEAIVGEIRDEVEPHALDIVKESADSYIVAGQTELAQIADQLHIELEGRDYSTVAGLVLAHLGHVPAPGEKVETNGVSFEVLEANQRTVLKVRLRLLPMTLSASAHPE